MPLTFAHPAAVLPFYRESNYIHFLALVIGSMSPDFEYFLRGKPVGEIGHTLLGFVAFNLPIVIVVYIIYRTCIHKPFFRHLPSCLQVNASAEKKSLPTWQKAVVFLYSALIGMFTHVAWDSFTHLDGLMVRNFSVLTKTVSFSEFSIPVFKFLQHGGTLFGISAIIAFMYYKAKKTNDDASLRAGGKQKLYYWAMIALLTVLLFIIWNMIWNTSLQAYGILVVRLIDASLISLLLVSLYVGKKIIYEN